MPEIPLLIEDSDDCAIPPDWIDRSKDIVPVPYSALEEQS